MKTIALWRWRYRDPASGRSVTTRHMATEDDARAQLPPDAQPVEWTREERRVPDTEAEREAIRTGHLARGPQS